MAAHETGPNPPFRYQVRASGLAEVWTHTRDDFKFSQFGWRCSNKESSYNNNTLIGNWNEQRFNLKDALQEKPLPSQFNHYFETTSARDFTKSKPPVGLDHPATRQRLRRAGREPGAFPSHQPELDHPLDKEVYNCYMTTSRCAFVDPSVRRSPLVIATSPESS